MGRILIFKHGVSKGGALVCFGRHEWTIDESY